MADFTELKAMVESGWKAQGDWREQAEEDFAFLAGHQWDDEARTMLEEQNRVPIVFNRVAVIISAVVGSEINNRTEVRFIPREIGDAKPNEVLTAGAEWFRDQSDAEDEESLAFEDLLTCGLGFTETRLDFEIDEEGQPITERLDPIEMCWDSHARKKGLADARWVARVRQMDRKEAKTRFPDADETEIDAAWVSSAKTSKHENIPGDEYRDENDPDQPTDVVTVVQIQYRERVTSVQFVTPDGQVKEMSEVKWAQIKKAMPVPPQSRKRTKWVWRQAFLGAASVLEENQPDPDGPTFQAITGHWDRKEKMFYGLLRPMVDPQKYANKWLTQTMHIINSNAKGGVLYEASAVEDPRTFEDSWAAADAATVVNEGALSNGKIQPKPQVQMPVALMNLTEFAISAIRDASGVNMELLGLRDQNQPGILEYQRKQAAMTTLAKFFDALRYYRKRQGAVLLHFLRNHIAPTGRLVRIVKEDQEQYIPLAMDDATAKFDVIVDDAPSAPNEKEKAWGVIENMMPMLQESGLSWAEWAQVLEYSPLPSSFVEMVKEKAEAEKKQGPDPMQQAMQQLAMKKEESEIVENQANAMLDQARTQQIATETQLAPVKAAADLYQPLPTNTSM